ncbi:trimethyllysine dioxygenase [Fusarium heterosporum]|uniref:Trimethyllysine dioxygenase n=1 Tax=Fusarium heterosporum TaxID=42747 RepID=A0A8H5WJN1_FUSHE|nr:trimethyllysine dioxygenase [Fusarium heterosporum]
MLRRLARCSRSQAVRSFKTSPVQSAAAQHASPELAKRRKLDEVSVTLTDKSQIRMKRHKKGESAEYRTFPNFWLRCVNPDTRQRNFDTFQVGVYFVIVQDGSDSHKSSHPWSSLRNSFKKGYVEEFGRDHPIRLWGQGAGDNSIKDSAPKVDYEYVLNKKEGMAQLTRNIWTRGFCFIENSPHTPEATESLLKKIGPIQNTHYGGFYDFIPDLAMADTAYTNLALPAHTDTTYFTEPAGLQAFHCLSHEAPPDADPSEPLGGESLLVDGFNCARILKDKHPAAYQVLQNTKIPWHASGNDGIAIAPHRSYPVIEKYHSQPFRIRWNNDDRGVVSVFDAEAWYDAARKWNEIVRHKSNEYWFKLNPGRILIFDNWRVMHGRSAFKGTRRICGAYMTDFLL